MTCGVCDPEAFQPTAAARVVGYAAFCDPMDAVSGSTVRSLYYMGAGMVLTDIARGHVKERPGYRMALKALRKGDRIVIDRMASLGSKPEHQDRNMARIKSMGAQIMVLTNA